MSMFCNQCEQTAGGKGCTISGACGKTPAVAAVQDALVAALVSMCRQGQPGGERDRLLVEGLFSTLTNVNFDEPALQALLAAVERENKALGAALWPAAAMRAGDDDIVSLRTTLLYGMKGIAAYYYHCMVLGHSDQEIVDWLYQGMAALAAEHTVEEWLGLLMAAGQCNLKAMALLDGANTGAYGHPEPTAVSNTIAPGPFVIITGHDLRDLEMLLEQTRGTGVNVYTHSEMLPAHGYPGLKKYPHLKGNYGTAWVNQRREFDGVPAPVVYTTNCIVPPLDSYSDRIFTTDVVRYPGIRHIAAGADGVKDFTPVIQQALALGGYPEAKAMPGANGGQMLTTGFARHTVLSVADQVIAAVKGGQLRHIFLVGGCDGSKAIRSYYRDFVQQTPADTVVLTLACGKYRFNDLALGTIGGLPRLMDMGQCNDAYSAIQVAEALAEAFDCGLNDLPLTLVLSWYEQKAVSILLTLLSLGIKGIYIGPSLPAFLSENVAKVLVEQFGLRPISTPEGDLAAILG